MQKNKQKNHHPPNDNEIVQYLRAYHFINYSEVVAGLT